METARPACSAPLRKFNALRPVVSEVLSGSQSPKLSTTGRSFMSYGAPKPPSIGTPLAIIFIKTSDPGKMLMPRCRGKSRVQCQALDVTQLHKATATGERNKQTISSSYVHEMVFQMISIFSLMPFCSAQIFYQSMQNFYDPLPHTHSQARSLLSLTKVRVSVQEVGFCLFLGPGRGSARVAPSQQQCYSSPEKKGPPCEEPQRVLTPRIGLHSCRSGLGPRGCSAIWTPGPPRPSPGSHAGEQEDDPFDAISAVGQYPLPVNPQERNLHTRLWARR